MKYMLDTNICIYLIKRRPAELVDRLQQEQLGDVGISAITSAELLYGVAKSQRKEQNMTALEKFLLPLVVAEFDDGAAAAYAITRATLEQRGTPIGSLDTLIAGHALSLNVTLVTHNTAEFSLVQDLRIEDWANS
jgi:tRNA(fMet)-specific endonuclease VapC